MTRDLSSWQVTSRAQRSLFLSPGARGPRRPASPGRPGRYGVGWPGHLLFTATDERDWDAVAAAFADRAALDCTSLSGGEPTVLSGRQIAQAWSATLGGLDATHHLTGNYLIDVEADRATALCGHRHPPAGRGHGDALWTLGARYHAELRRTGGRWLITALTMTAVWGQGNQAILGQAGPDQRRPK